MEGQLLAAPRGWSFQFLWKSAPVSTLDCTTKHPPIPGKHARGVRAYSCHPRLVNGYQAKDRPGADRGGLGRRRVSRRLPPTAEPARGGDAEADLVVGPVDGWRGEW